ncbi:nucleoid-associated protein [Rhizobium sp. 007]|uniref:nucleoid-associated protein n=1 Tax=Rhizobium sp. 007 TaxID=2785056 RepID=UPI0018905A1E|nr:nucleoid-associated protein [Rhizobium sp. 007]QPB21763.1 nucleoid-associated protein [Rhizobium sp. 007]
MQLENLKINRVVMHEVLKRDDDRQPKDPVYGEALEDLEAAAKGAFTLRVTEALSTQSKSIEMHISDFSASSMVDIAGRLIDLDDTDFLEVSKEIAVRLASAQKARSIPGGVVIAFDGSFGVPERKFLGVIKAETQSGFRRSKNAEKILTEFLDNIFLTPATRLYKIGFLVQEPKDDGFYWRAIIFDSNISSSHRETAAQYFYESFFGCLFPANGAYETSRFYDLTKELCDAGRFHLTRSATSEMRSILS